MSDGNSACPDGLRLLTSPIRSCAIPGTDAMATAILPVLGRYARVCGRTTAIQKGSPDAFLDCFRGPADVYVDGITIRHGCQYKEGHIWTFTATATQQYYSETGACPCAFCNYSLELSSF